jgi:hypothetical protein
MDPERAFRRRRRIRLQLESLEDRTVPTVFTPAQIRHAYGFDQITFSNGAVAGDGSGQTIAIVDAYDDPTIAADLHTFDQTFGLPDPTLTKVEQSGTVANKGWSVEISLDVEWAHAIAPGAKILLVEARSANITDLLAAVDYAAARPGVSTVSMSWGGGEFSGESSNDANFNTPAGHQGVTFVAAAGDDGAAPTWPAVAPNVLSVGGTSLVLNTAGDYQSETTWAGSGGGISTGESRPVYQTFVTTNSTTKRTNPDVSYDANPNTGVYVCDTFDGAWFEVGGTSAGAPQWAALVAIADQGRALAGKSTLDGGSQTLYAIYRMGQTSSATYFHDITTGSNGYSAKLGYDDATGNGSPIANRIVAGLVSWSGSGKTGSLNGVSASPLVSPPPPPPLPPASPPPAPPAPPPRQGSQPTPPPLKSKHAIIAIVSPGGPPPESVVQLAPTPASPPAGSSATTTIVAPTPFTATPNESLVSHGLTPVVNSAIAFDPSMAEQFNWGWPLGPSTTETQPQIEGALDIHAIAVADSTTGDVPVDAGDDGAP